MAFCGFCTKNWERKRISCGIYLVDKCPRQRYNRGTFNKEVMIVTAMVSANTNSFSCSSTAAVSTSVHNIPLLDTAISLVVSICVLLGLLRIIEPKT